MRVGRSTRCCFAGHRLGDLWWISGDIAKRYLKLVAVLGFGDNFPVAGVPLDGRTAYESEGLLDGAKSDHGLDHKMVPTVGRGQGRHPGIAAVRINRSLGGEKRAPTVLVDKVSGPGSFILCDTVIGLVMPVVPPTIELNSARH